MALENNKLHEANLGCLGKNQTARGLERDLDLSRVWKTQEDVFQLSTYKFVLQTLGSRMQTVFT